MILAIWWCCIPTRIWHLFQCNWSGWWWDLPAPTFGCGWTGSAAWSAIKSLFSLGLDACKALLSAAIAGWKAIATQIMQGIQAAFNAGVALVKSAATAVVDGAKAVFTGAINAVVDIGRRIVDGLISGIKAGAHLVYDAAAVVNSIPLAIRKLMGIASPSKVTTELGEQVGDGLAKGIENKQPTIFAAVDAIAAGVTARMNTIVAQAQAAAQAAQDSNITSIASSMADAIFTPANSATMLANAAKVGHPGDVAASMLGSIAKTAIPAAAASVKSNTNIFNITGAIGNELFLSATVQSALEKAQARGYGLGTGGLRMT